jgi:hypothetical protein
MRPIIVGVLFLGAVSFACNSDTILAPLTPTPENLGYELEPSGDPDEPMGILLFWDPVTSPDLLVYRVYSRPDPGAAWGLRGETTSITFHDNGIPDLEYHVVSVDLNGVESPPSVSVVIDERLRLQAPAWIQSTSLNGALHVAWADNAFEMEPSGFKQYRLYSAFYDLDTGFCADDWGLEGTTVAPEFLVSAINNGEPLCVAVTAESIEGYESMWSPIRADTPRPDARNVIMTAREFRSDSAGFRFWQDLNNNGIAEENELGLIRDASAINIDFYITRDPSNFFYLQPVRQGTGVRLYNSDPLPDLTSIDFAPVGGYSEAAIQARPLYGYVFAMDGGDGWARYGGLRVTHVGQNYMIFDWSYQTDPGNPELSVGGGIFTAGAGGGILVKR